MSEVHNLNYYINFFTSVQEVKKRHKKKGYIHILMNPLDRTTRVVSSIFTDYFLLPFIKQSYDKAGRVATLSTALVSTRLSNWVKKSWDDPIPTRMLLMIEEIVEKLTRATAKATPTKLPILGTIDKCRIQIGRHLYIVSKDFNSLLRIPNALRDYVNWNTVDMSPKEKAEPSTFAQKGWILFKKGTKLLSNALLALIAKVIEIAAYPLEKIPYLKETITWIGQKVDAARNHIHKSIIKKAHEVIDHQEVKIRKSVIAKIGEITVRKLVNETLNLGIKFYISKEVYQLAKYGISQAIGYQDFPEELETLAFALIKIAGFTLFLHTIAPTIEQLHDAYKQDFNTEASTLRELASLVNRRNLSQILVLIKNRFKSTIS